jgi:hypothetical protein
MSRAGSGHGSVKGALFRFLLPRAMPESIVVALAADADTGNSHILIFVSMGKIVRVLKVFGAPLNKALF